MPSAFSEDDEDDEDDDGNFDFAALSDWRMGGRQGQKQNSNSKH
jgi:hypothetical protein